MREIKFRAWDKDERKWCDYPVYIDSNGETYYEHYERGLDNNVNVEINQYTGLKDKNGIEIFEGDVYEDGDSKRHVVTFKNGGFGRVGRFLINYHTNESLLTHKPLINDVIDGCEVIGNIYENPELLEVES